MANLQRDQGQHARAVATHRAALALYQQLVADFPSVPEYRRDVGRSHHNLGASLSSLEQRDGAEAAYHAALTVREQLEAEFPREPGYAADLGSSYRNYGLFLTVKGDLPAALVSYAKAIAALEPVVRTEPRLGDARENLRLAHRARAKLLDSLHRYGDAVLHWDRVVQLDRGMWKAQYQEARTRSHLLDLVSKGPARPRFWEWSN